MGFADIGLPSTKKLELQDIQDRVQLPTGETVPSVGFGRAPGMPAPAGPMNLGNEEQEGPSEFDIAAQRDAQRDADAALQARTAMGAMVGGGYRPEALKLNERIQEAYRTGLAGLEDVEKQTLALQQNPERAALMQQEVERQKKAVVDEQARMGRMQEIGKKQETLSGEMAKKVDEFKVDPNRMFGQGGERAMSVFALGLANIFSNIGEAMQGKAGTNAVLGFVRDRIAQDISLQEADYQRMLQGYNVRRNGLMDAIQMVGNERQGAEALARQQALAYAGQLGAIEQKLTDAKARGVVAQAKATILAQYGQAEQTVEAQNVAARNQAAAQSAATAARQSELRAQATGAGLSDKEAGFVSNVLEKADKQQLMTRTQALGDFRKALSKADNTALNETRGMIASVIKAIGEDKDRSSIENKIASMAVGSMSPQAQQILTSWQRYIGGRLRAQGGTAITPAERSLFDLNFYTTPQGMRKLADDEYKVARTEAQSLLRSAPFRQGSPAYDFLGARLGQFVGGYQTEPDQPPPDAGTIKVPR